MTDRIRTLTVILDRDMRADDVEHVFEAIKMVKFVAEVKLGKPVDIDQIVALSDFRTSAANALVDAVLAIARGESFTYTPKKS
jgi:hypothetical protein